MRKQNTKEVSAGYSMIKYPRRARSTIWYLGGGGLEGGGGLGGGGLGMQKGNVLDRPQRLQLACTCWVP